MIRRYNNATSYALAVDRLSRRIAGEGPIRAAWPRADRCRFDFPVDPSSCAGGENEPRMDADGNVSRRAAESKV